jgi:hypothetical protein
MQKRIIILVTLLAIQQAETQARAEDSYFFPGWMSRFEARFSMTAGSMSIGNVPKQYRFVSGVELSNQTSGDVIGIALGSGLSLTGVNWLEFFLDVESRFSMGPISYSWNDIGSNAGISGYPYHAFVPRMSVKLVPFSNLFTIPSHNILESQVYLKGACNGTLAPWMLGM